MPHFAEIEKRNRSCERAAFFIPSSPAQASPATSARLLWYRCSTASLSRAGVSGPSANAREVAGNGAARVTRECNSSRNRYRLHCPRARPPSQVGRAVRHLRWRLQSTRPPNGFRDGSNGANCFCGCCCGCTLAWLSATRRGGPRSGTGIHFLRNSPLSQSMPLTEQRGASSRGWGF